MKPETFYLASARLGGRLVSLDSDRRAEARREFEALKQNLPPATANLRGVKAEIKALEELVLRSVNP